MRVLLISPNTLTVPYPVYPLGLDYVAGALNNKHQVEIADLNLLDLDGLQKLMANFHPDIIGISIRNIDNTDASSPQFFIDGHKKLVQWLRSRCGVPLVGGGAGFTILPHEIFKALDLDFGIIGEGERFDQLLTALENKEPVNHIPGLLSRSQKAVRPEPWLGAPIRQTAKNDHSQFYLEHGGMLNLQTKRGCSFSCIYCPYPHIEGKKHRLMEPDAVARTALKLQERGAQYIFITDSAFNSDISHSLAVAKAFRKQKLTIPWGGFFAPLKHPDGYFRTMAECGLKHVEFGTESLSGTMLHNYRKPFTPATVVKTHARAITAGLRCAHYFLLGGPGETEETLGETLDNIENLPNVVLFFFTGIRIYPHTGLYETALHEGQISKETDLLYPFYYKSSHIKQTTIEELVLKRAGGRSNWIVGSGGKEAAATVNTLHERGLNGPLWEFLIR